MYKLWLQREISYFLCKLIEIVMRLLVRIILIPYLGCKISQSKLVSLRSEMTDLSHCGPLSRALQSAGAHPGSVCRLGEANILMVTIMLTMVTMGKRVTTASTYQISIDITL